MLFLDLKIGAGITLDGTATITVNAVENGRVSLLANGTRYPLTIGQERRFGELRVILKSVTGNTARIGFETPSDILLTPHNWP